MKIQFRNYKEKLITGHDAGPLLKTNSSIPQIPVMIPMITNLLLLKTWDEYVENGLRRPTEGWSQSYMKRWGFYGE